MKLLHAFALGPALGLALSLLPARTAGADTGVDIATWNDKAFAKYGLSGAGVIVAILDRGIDYTHPDFRNADGTTRIKMMWDMSNANPQRRRRARHRLDRAGRGQRARRASDQYALGRARPGGRSADRQDDIRGGARP